MIYRIVFAIGKHVIAQDTLAGGGVGVGIEESADLGIVITGLEVVEPGLSVVNVALSKSRAQNLTCSLL